MYIRRKVFSTYIDEETGEEKLFSVNEIISEDEYVERLYAETAKEEKKKKVGLSNIDSHRGLGRSLAIGQLPGAIAAHAGKKAANKADEEGKSDDEIIKEASKAGRKRGMKIGALQTGAATLGTAGLGAIIGRGNGHNRIMLEDLRNLSNYEARLDPQVKKNLLKEYTKTGAKRGAILGAAVGLAGGALTTAAGHYGARKNAEKRLEKRNALENEINSK